MTSHDPAAQSAYRVPRSPIDDFYDRGEPLPASRVGTAEVVSIDGDTMTVRVGDEEIGGVVFLGDEPPIGEAVDLESRGDLLVTPYVLDVYVEGGGNTAQHIVDDQEPPFPPPVEVNVGSSMRDLTAWDFYGTDQLNWTRLLSEDGVGMRCLQGVPLPPPPPPPPSVTHRNLVINPSFEINTVGWNDSVPPGLSAANVTLISTSEQHQFAQRALKATWTGGTTGYVMTHLSGLTVGATHVIEFGFYRTNGSSAISIATVNANGVLTRGQSTEDSGSIWNEWTGFRYFFTPTTSEMWVGLVTTPVAGNPPLTGVLYLDGVIVLEADSLSFYFDGDTPDTDTDTFSWTGTPHASTSERVDTLVPPPEEEVAPPVANEGILWSDETVDITPGDILDIEAHFAELVPSTTVQVALLYGGVVDADPAPGDTDTLITYHDGWTTITGADTVRTEQIVVPVLVGLPVSGSAAPRTARLGFRLIGDGDAQLVVTSTTMVHTITTWPLGSIWMNPIAGDALPTVATTPQTITTGTTLAYQGSTSSWGRLPVGNKALVTAPADCGGVVMAWASFNVGPIATTTTTTGVHFTVEAALDYLSYQAPYTRIATTTYNTNHQLPVSVMGWARIAAGATVELTPKYQYTADPGATGQLTVRSYAMTVMFIPTATVTSAGSKPAPISFWDGDSWRPTTLDPAAINVTKAATVVEGVKTATTTTLAVSAASVHEGSPVTLTATVAPSTGGGSVTFSRAPSATPTAWVPIGTVPLSAGRASFVFTTDGYGGSWYFKADYSGAADYAVSAGTSALVKVTRFSTSTRTFYPTYARGYQGDGDKIVGSGHDTAVFQGETSADGDRKSLLGFAFTAPSGAVEYSVTSVLLVCKSWVAWSNNTGTVVLGSLRGQATMPTTYPTSKVISNRSRHAVGEGAWSANITSWGAAEVRRSDFDGIAIGPAPNGSSSEVYQGRSADSVQANKVFELRVTTEQWS